MASSTVVYPHTCGKPNDPPAVYETEYTGNSGNDLGLSTAGYTSGKYSTDEWEESNYSKYYKSFEYRDDASHASLSANDLLKNAEEAERKKQAENTKKLAERLKDINYWKFELNREIKDMITETDSMVEQKRRLENALRNTEIPLHIATDNLNVRQRRQGIDLVQDDVELCLLKEIEVINNAQDLLRRTIKEADLQIRRNRDQKENLEMDWSDKKEADELDTFCVQLRNEHTCKQFYPGSAKFQEIQSTPESWAQFSHDNICAAERERLASIQLRGLIDNVLHDISADIIKQAEATDTALRMRIEQTEEAKARLEEELKKLCKSIIESEKTIRALKDAIKAKDDPMKVAQTRLHKREFRPNVELCRDPPQYGLIEEVKLLENTTELLMQKLADAESALSQLQDQRIRTEQDISCKKNSLFIDREKCVPHRTRYPTGLQLQGYK